MTMLKDTHGMKFSQNAKIQLRRKTMGKLVVATIEVDEEEMEMRISDIQRINHLPVGVQNLIKEHVKGRKLNSSGLPSVQYLGPNRTMVVGAFNYGDISFLEVEGKWKNIEEGDTLTCITAYRPNKTYEELVEGREDYKKEIKEKYPNGVTVE